MPRAVSGPHGEASEAPAPLPAPASVPAARGRAAGAVRALVSGHSIRRLARSTWLPAAAILAVAVFLRFWQLTAIGFNSDEAVYTGSAASLAGDRSLGAMFPVFRAHPLLFQVLLSLVLRLQEGDWPARAFAAAIGVAAVAMTFLLGSRLYGRRAGLLAALVLALMPYHVIVSRQVLLDGQMTLCATAVLYCVVRYLDRNAVGWLLAAAGLMGATVLTKETSIVLIGGLYAFSALTPSIRMRLSHLLLALATMTAVVAVWPVALQLSGKSRTGQNYLLWQLFRRPNHGLWFYFTVLPSWIGPAILAAAVAGLIWLRHEATWRERLLLGWVIVPVVFFTVWPVKGFQYLLPIAPPLAVLAGRTLSRPLPMPSLPRLGRPWWLPGAAMGALTLATAVSLAVPTWRAIEPSPTSSYLAGTGGVDGGREAGEWVLRHVPEGARLLAVGPSMANILEFYGGHRVYALSVSPSARNHNPSYVPVPNPDRALRDGDFQYIVWDSYTAARSPFFGAEAHRLAEKFHGVAVYTGTVGVDAPSGDLITDPVIVIYQVRP